MKNKKFKFSPIFCMPLKWARIPPPPMAGHLGSGPEAARQLPWCGTPGSCAGGGASGDSDFLRGAQGDAGLWAPVATRLSWVARQHGQGPLSGGPPAAAVSWEPEQ